MKITELYGYPDYLPKEGLTKINGNLGTEFIYRMGDNFVMVSQEEKLNEEEMLLILNKRIKEINENN